jgi:hypothetical protein
VGEIAISPHETLRRPVESALFLCGDGNSSDEHHSVGFGHVLQSDPTIDEVLDLPAGFEAERTELGKKWHQSKLPA